MKIRDIVTSLKVGARVYDLGEIEGHYVIRFKGYYIDVLLGKDEIKSLGWSEDVGMFDDVPIRDFWTAQPPAPKNEQRG